MNILHLLNNFGDSSISRIVRDLVLHLGQQNFTWHVGGLNGIGDMCEEFRRVGARVVDFAGTSGSSRKILQGIRNYVAENNIQIVHTHTPRGILMLRLALGRTKKPLHIATKHILNFPRDRHWGMFYSLADRLLLYSPDHLVAVSGKVSHEILACPGIQNARVTIIRNAVDSTPYYLPDQRNSCREEFGLTPDQILIGTSGRLEKVKRYDLLIEAFSNVLTQAPHMRLMVAGDGTLAHELKSSANERKIGHAVIWTGFRNDIPRLLAAMDIYCMPSANEGLSLSILEAMAAAKPVIITDVGGARELVEDGKTGRLIPPGSVLAIEEAILDLARNPDKMAAIAQAGRSYVTQEFGILRMMESYERLYATMEKRLPDAL